MRVFLTGGTGFIGGEVARLLRARAALGCELVPGDLRELVAAR